MAGRADNSHITDDVSFPTIPGLGSGCVCGGHGGGCGESVFFLVNVWSPQFLVPFTIIISTFLKHLAKVSCSFSRNQATDQLHFLFQD